MKRIGSAWLVAGSLIATSCGPASVRVAGVDSSAKSQGPAPTSVVGQTAPVTGFALTSSEFRPILLTTKRSWPDVASDIAITVFRDPAGGILTIVDEQISSEGRPEVVGATDPSVDNSQAVVVTNSRQLTVTVSGVQHARSVRDDVTAALMKAARDTSVEIALRAAAAQFELRDQSSAGGVGTGYAVTYSDGDTDITLAVNPVADSTEVQANDVLSARTFVQHRGNREYVTEPAVAGDPTQVRWIESGYLVSLIGPARQVKTLLDEVRPVSSDPGETIGTLIVSNLRATPLIDSVQMSDRKIERHEGVRGGSGSVCVLDKSGAVGCAQYALVGSIASVLVGSDWLLVVIVPSAKPTTHFRTSPGIDFESVTVNEFDWSVGVPDSEVQSISISYGTEGIANDFVSTLLRPG